MVSAQWDAGLRAGAEPAFALSVTWPDGSTDNLEYVTGSVSVDSTAAVRRSCTFELADMSAWRDVVLGGATLRPYRGQVYTDGTPELAPLGVFEVTATDDPMDLTPGKITAPDRMARVIRSRYLVPRESADLTIPGQIGVLLAEPFPDGTFSLDDQTGDTTRCPHLVWDRDRQGSVFDLASSIGAEVFFNTLGDLVLRPVPQITEPAWTLDDGEGGLLTGGSVQRTVEGAYSVIVVNPARTDGSAPFAPVVVRDTDTSSPTYVDGPFGEVMRPYSSAAITTADQALAAGLAQLELSKGFAATVSVSAAVNAALLEGQTVAVAWAGERQLHIAEAFTVGMDVEGSEMSLKTRSRSVQDS